MNSNNLKFSTILFLICASSCMVNQCENGHEQDCIKSKTRDITLKKNIYYIVGNFDGDGKDTIFFHYYSHYLNREIDLIPSSDNDWNDIIVWFNAFQIETYFTYKKDTLKIYEIGDVYGLFCLLNIGDVNSDGKEEFAFVVDILDYSRLNSCEIYSICQSRFYKLKSFAINEDVFDTRKPDSTSFPTDIKHYLEKQNNVWYYCSYDDYMDEDVPIMKVLDLEKCH